LANCARKTLRYVFPLLPLKGVENRKRKEGARSKGVGGRVLGLEDAKQY